MEAPGEETSDQVGEDDGDDSYCGDDDGEDDEGEDDNDDKGCTSLLILQFFNIVQKRGWVKPMFKKIQIS